MYGCIAFVLLGSTSKVHEITSEDGFPRYLRSPSVRHLYVYLNFIHLSVISVELHRIWLDPTGEAVAR